MEKAAGKAAGEERVFILGRGSGLADGSSPRRHTGCAGAVSALSNSEVLDQGERNVARSKGLNRFTLPLPRLAIWTRSIYIKMAALMTQENARIFDTCLP